MAVQIDQQDYVERYQEPKSNKSSPDKNLKQPEYNNFMEASEILERDDEEDN